MPPNPAVNTDAPPAGLRPLGGPPVNLLRWASLSLIRFRPKADNRVRTCLTRLGLGV